MRKLLVTLLVLVALAVAADRGSLLVAQRLLAEKARSSAGLTSTPTVRLHGFPFLTQALRGRYDDIDVTATDLDRGGARIARLSATIHGARVPLSEAVHGTLPGIGVGGIDATALVSYVEIAHRSGLAGFTITPDGDGVKVTARVRVMGVTVTASARSVVTLKGNQILLTARATQAVGRQLPAVANALKGALDLRIPIGTMPFHLALTGVHPTTDGVELTARSGATILSGA